MQTTSALWRSMMLSDTARLRTKATIGGVEYTDMLPPVVRRALMDNAVTIGNCVSASLTLNLKSDNSTTENIPRSAQVLLSMWWEDEAGNVSETLPVGTFYVSHRQYVNRTKRMTLECYDAMLKANAPIGDAGITEWPAQIGVVVSAIAAAMGVDVDSRNHYRSTTLTIPEPAEGATMRDVLGGIAALHGGNWYITPAGKLRLKWIYYQGPPGLVEYQYPEYVTSDVVMVRGVTGAMLYDVIPGDGDARYTFTGLRVINESGERLVGNENGVVVTLKSNWADSGWVSWLWDRMQAEYWWPVIIEGAFYDPAAELGDWLNFDIWIEVNGDPAFTDGYCMLCMETITLGPAPRANVSMPAPGEAEDEYPYVSSAEQQALQTRTRLDALETQLGTQGDQLDALEAQVEALGDPVDVDHGGTGATDAADARANLEITPENIGAVDKAGDTITGTLILSKTTDASGTSDNGPALVVGGTRTTQHIEIDGNEIVAKSDGTHGSRLSLNFDGGGDVYIGPGGLTIGKPLDIGSGGTGQNGVSSATAITFGTTDSRVTGKSGSFCRWGKLVTVHVAVTFTGATTPFNVGQNLDIVLSNIPTPADLVNSITYSGGYFFPARLHTDKTMRYRNSMGNGNISGQVSGAEVTFVYLTSD